jgi:hypothetical protein
MAAIERMELPADPGCCYWNHFVPRTELTRPGTYAFVALVMEHPPADQGGSEPWIQSISSARLFTATADPEPHAPTTDAGGDGGRYLTRHSVSSSGPRPGRSSSHRFGVGHSAGPTSSRQPSPAFYRPQPSHCWRCSPSTRRTVRSRARTRDRWHPASSNRPATCRARGRLGSQEWRSPRDLASLPDRAAGRRDSRDRSRQRRWRSLRHHGVTRSGGSVPL